MPFTTRHTLFAHAEELRHHLDRLRKERRTLVVTEANCARLCLGRIGIETADVVLPAGEEAKSLASLTLLWERLTEGAYSRADRMIAIGGGALLDVAGFAAATYRRGMRLVSLPTTLLAQVDAAIGGKTAIDFDGVKNGIGTFYPAEEVAVLPDFLSTLPEEELLSGRGEVLKYALLGAIPLREEMETVELIGRCIRYKEEVVGSDPLDRGGRRQLLNLGHTIGHALEAHSLSKGAHIPHGIAVAAGLVVEGYLSFARELLPQEQMLRIARLVLEQFPPVSVSCSDYDELIRLARQDKKQEAGETKGGIPVVLLAEIGRPTGLVEVSAEEVKEALDFYRDFMHI